MRSALIFIGALVVLWAAQAFLMPLAIALAIWGVTAIGGHWMDDRLAGLPPAARRAAVAAALVAAALAMGAVLSMMADEASSLAERLPAYEANFDAILKAAATSLGVHPPPTVLSAFESVDLRSVALGLAGSALGVFGSAVVIVCYVAFLFVEARAFSAKLDALIPDPARRDRVARIVEAAVQSVRVYLGVQTLVAFVQAALTWAVLALVGVDAPLFWATVIFLLGFIPTLGSMIGIAAPSLFALAQFGAGWEFAAALAPSTVVQLGASNILQPAMMGGALNISSLAVFAAVFGGGALWGITGALLEAPALSVFAIVCAQNAELRPLAILLSRDGRVDPEEAQAEP